MPSPRLAKLSVPRATAIARPRVHRLLDEAVARGAAFIAAGPGAGKSTLAAAWATPRAGRLLWYRSDAGDADPGEAFGYFRSLAGASPRVRALPTYRPRDVDRLDVFATSFFRAFYRVVPAASTLVVDDAHMAGDDAFVTLLAAAIREAPADVAVVVLSRREPTGPLLDDVASGRLHVLDGGALAFDESEAVALLAGRTGAAAARALQARTEGWAAGMLLLAQSAEPVNAVRDTATRRVAAYFDERVLASFDDATLRMLAIASLLPEVDEASLARLGLGAIAAERLERLRRENAFVARLDRAPASWRLHDLLRDALRERFRTIADAQWRRAALLAAAPLAAELGHVRDAVQMYVDAGERGHAKTLAEQRARGLVRGHRLVELDAVVGALTDEEARGSVVLQLALGESAWQRNDATGAVGHFERAYALLDEPPSADGAVVASSALNAIFEGWQSYDGTRTWADRLRYQLAARDRITDPHDQLRVDRTWLQTADQLWDDSLCDRPALFDRVLARVRDPGAGITVDEVVGASAALIESSGFNLHDEARFQATVAATAGWLARTDLAPLVKAMWLNSYAGLGRHWPSPGVRLPAAGGNASLELAHELARAHGGHSLAFIAADFLCNAAVTDNDLTRARHWLERARETSDPRHAVQAAALLGTEAVVLALDGDWRRSLAAFDRAEALARAHGHPETDLWSRTLGRHRVLIASGEAARARESLLRHASAYPEGLRRDFALILADVAAADVEWAEHGAIPPALVTTIMERARAYDWRGITILLGPVVARICSEALRLGIEVEFARRLVREKRLPAPSPYASHWPWPVRIHALGGFRIVVDERPLAFGPRAQRKPLDLVKAIVAHGPTPVDAAVVLDALWPDAEGAAARASFDMTVMRLRKLLGRDDALVLDAGHLGFDPACVWVDAHAFAHGATDDYAGPLFGNDAVERWWAAARERLHQRFLRRTLERGVAFEREGDAEAALAVYEAGLAQDPLAEDLYQGAIRCHLVRNRPADALRVFRRCREQLSIVLSVSPSPATLALVETLHAR